MALLLSLFSDPEMSGVGSSSIPSAPVVSSVPSEACSPGSAEVVDPCLSCPLAGLCDPSECGSQLFPLDSPLPPVRFKNLGELIKYLKRYDWA